MAAATVISGKRATKETKVIAAASRVQCVSSSVSYARHAWVRMRRAIHGPMTGSPVSQSMSYVCSSRRRSFGSLGYENPPPGRGDPRPTSRTARPVPDRGGSFPVFLAFLAFLAFLRASVPTSRPAIPA